MACFAGKRVLIFLNPVNAFTFLSKLSGSSTTSYFRVIHVCGSGARVTSSSVCSHPGLSVCARLAVCAPLDALAVPDVAA